MGKSHPIIGPKLRGSAGEGLRLFVTVGFHSGARLRPGGGKSPPSLTCHSRPRQCWSAFMHSASPDTFLRCSVEEFKLIPVEPSCQHLHAVLKPTPAKQMALLLAWHTLPVAQASIRCSSGPHCISRGMSDRLWSRVRPLATGSPCTL